MKLRSIFRIINASVIIVMVTMAVILFATLSNLDRDSDWVNHTYEVILMAEKLRGDMIDQETGLRGYLITGDETYLEPYNQAKETYKSRLNALKVKVSDNPDQVVLLEDLEDLALSWENEVAERYFHIKDEIVESGHVREELIDLTTSGLGKDKMDYVRLLVEDIEDEALRMNILISMINMETGVRAYIINEKEVFLEPYYQGRTTLDVYLNTLNNQAISSAAYDWIINVAEKEIDLVQEASVYLTNQDLNDELSKGRDQAIMNQIRNKIDVFEQVEQDLLLDRRIQSDLQFRISHIALYIASAIIVLAGISLYFATNKVTKPLVNFTSLMKDFDVDNIDKQVEIETYGISEINTMINGYKSLLDMLRGNIEERESNNWIQQGQMQVGKISEESLDIDDFLSLIIKYVTKKVKGLYGSIYILDTTDNNKYTFGGGYALDKLSEIRKSYQVGEGLIGQAVLDKELIRLYDVPEDYLKIDSSLGSTLPSLVVILPCVFEGQVIAVLEIALLAALSDRSDQFLNKIGSDIGIVIKNAMSRDEIKMLLEAANEANNKLELQKEELKVTNSELESQSAALMNSQSELEVQQENLKAINEELEENTRLLESQRKELETRNIELEESKKIIEDKSDKLEQSSQYKSEFLANMSHELRTPLNSILLLSELLRESELLSEEETEYAETINKSGKGLLALINDILDLSKVEAGHVEVFIEPLEIRQFVTDTSNLFRQVSEESQLNFSIQVEDGVPDFIDTDEMKLKQIINNLLSNAFKFTSHGRVSLSIAAKEDKIYFEVADTGIGISEDKLELIFSAFKQEDGTTSRKFGGTGLGLSISSEYAKLLEGSLVVESKKDSGSRFILSIPLKRTKLDIIEKADNKVEEYVEDDRKHIDKDDKVLLIIEDDPTSAQVIKEISKRNDFKVLIAETGETGLHLADFYLPSGIILDIGLPGMDGYEVMKRLKSNDRTKDIPINIISGKDLNDDLLDQDVQFYRKPVNKATIVDILNNTLSEKKEKKKILLHNAVDLDLEMIKDLSKIESSHLEILECKSDEEAMDITGQTMIDLVIMDLDTIGQHEVYMIDQMKLSSMNKSLSILIYTNDSISQRDEVKLRKQVDDIIIKEGDSKKRLLDEVKLFVNRVKHHRGHLESDTYENDLFAGKSVLIVDDDMRNVFALSTILNKLGIKTEIANNGQEALDLIGDIDDLDLVLMDIMMPVMDGYEAIKSIRKMDKYLDLPIIALTAKAMKGDKELCIKAGANEYLPKPIDRNKLMSLLRVWL
ncbi:response regulator [Acidaminobacter sp. JC074]|uniref:CHASE3 domain-containing protein n=1 Tax=Acidaminobacter sp. JC074 TaxID=2530199 RepID=UPI001F0D56CF|nr:CHASE3 domain-containing protein [Acidaminobacter sp. JC074]MCH4887880.1 response regulator [Acidaminobacter sp. JC074]